MTAPLRHPLCTATPAVQSIERRARKIFEQLGPKLKEAPSLFQCGAPWTGHASDEELVRLAKLQGRIERRQAAIREMRAERGKIMQRCIRRMRRERGQDL